MEHPLVARGLSKRFGALEAVKKVSLTLARGEVLAFLGPNGAGKTTTIKMVAGLLQPDEGRVEIAGKDPHRDPWALREVGAVLEGNRNLYWRLTPLENLLYFGVARGLRYREALDRARALLEAFGLAEKAGALVRTLSRGMQQRLALAVALIHRPSLLLLDEPTLGLDVESALAVQEEIRRLAEEGYAILLTTHQLDVAQRLSHRVAILRAGEVVLEGRTEEVLSRFSGTHYTLVLGEDPPEAVQARLLARGLEGEGRRWVYLGPPEGLWEVLDLVRPLPLERLEKDRADLTEVFLKVLKG
ncbi:ABC transporter ATP-binding protein [Thermus filiformis]|uniref:Multidrug ABC transporter ATP-binding protein n=1 Tax=Thermus filiformis TaxID=276 RepID=A0A0A2WWZ4_THEFI|nr:ABC transporter ATP-binding protein [Thermus filiformis]KGQ22805.1 multidrug ABC transporter ATP-binding protein [Thermus filiformis]